MKSLENYGVQEMNKQDIKDTEGGFFILATLALAYVLYRTYKYVQE
jgi:hypothetical protein